MLRRRLIAGLCMACAGLGARAAETDVIAAAKPSVVAVGTFRAADSPRFTFRGTGFVAAEGNLVVTSAHVLPETLPPDARVMVLVSRAGEAPEPRSASLVATVRPHDLSLLRVDGTALPALALAAPEPVAEGTGVVFIGFPIGGLLGFRPVSHRGMVASITPSASPAANSRQLNEQAFAQLRRGSFDVYQLDGTAYPGNSGGPLIDVASGRVIGVVNMGVVKGAKESALTHPSGITYALPVRLVHELLKMR